LRQLWLVIRSAQSDGSSVCISEPCLSWQRVVCSTTLKCVCVYTADTARFLRVNPAKIV